VQFDDGFPDDAFVEAVRQWWPSNARDLPWRHTRDPWAILVSEIMAQQTQVGRVVPSWRRFLERFPTPADAAAASSGALVAMWSGLGYNRRAVLLHRCAGEITERHGGVVPGELGALLELPGVGPYTARAVLAFAFETDVAVVDTNVGRILARVHGETLNARTVQVLADSLVPPGRGWEWNQAMLDFGALVCSKKTPSCAVCPVRGVCTWAGSGEDPAVGSASVSVGQSPFIGSDRQGRGRLVAALRSGTVDERDAARLMGWEGDETRAVRVVETLISDGLVVRTGGHLVLP
jgi:A/G-specific adenine glycosylase